MKYPPVHMPFQISSAQTKIFSWLQQRYPEAAGGPAGEGPGRQALRHEEVPAEHQQGDEATTTRAQQARVTGIDRDFRKFRVTGIESLGNLESEVSSP